MKKYHIRPETGDEKDLNEQRGAKRASIEIWTLIKNNSQIEGRIWLSALWDAIARGCEDVEKFERISETYVEHYKKYWKEIER